MQENEGILRIDDNDRAEILHLLQVGKLALRTEDGAEYPLRLATPSEYAIRQAEEILGLGEPRSDSLDDVDRGSDD